MKRFTKHRPKHVSPPGSSEEFDYIKKSGFGSENIGDTPSNTRKSRFRHRLKKRPKNNAVAAAMPSSEKPEVRLSKYDDLKVKITKSEGKFTAKESFLKTVVTMREDLIKFKIQTKFTAAECEAHFLYDEAKAINRNEIFTSAKSGTRWTDSEALRAMVTMREEATTRLSQTDPLIIGTPEATKQKEAYPSAKSKARLRYHEVLRAKAKKRDWEHEMYKDDSKFKAEMFVPELRQYLRDRTGTFRVVDSDKPFSSNAKDSMPDSPDESFQVAAVPGETDLVQSKKIGKQKKLKALKDAGLNVDGTEDSNQAGNPVYLLSGDEANGVRPLHFLVRPSELNNPRSVSGDNREPPREPVQRNNVVQPRAAKIKSWYLWIFVWLLFCVIFGFLVAKGSTAPQGRKGFNCLYNLLAMGSTARQRIRGFKCLYNLLTKFTNSIY